MKIPAVELRERHPSHFERTIAFYIVAEGTTHGVWGRNLLRRVYAQNPTQPNPIPPPTLTRNPLSFIPSPLSQIGSSIDPETFVSFSAARAYSYLQLQTVDLTNFPLVFGPRRPPVAQIYSEETACWANRVFVETSLLPSHLSASLKPLSLRFVPSSLAAHRRPTATPSSPSLFPSSG
ncbi:hypothetical protein PIB30_019974 [Stylosanthes scabra]|uniref:Uncharacterized protein n=1 Tax=Stylosanthes scabra TaxID=79078 RepID=A0ABU6Y5L9_9FABA|nr:hypothetical protein [Stylosanthes scabra]